jgi:hypothetical protein
MQGLARILEAGRVDEADDLPAVDAHRKGLADHGFPGDGADPHRIVLGQGGKHRGLALVGMADDGEFRDGAWRSWLHQGLDVEAGIAHGLHFLAPDLHLPWSTGVKMVAAEGLPISRMVSGISASRTWRNCRSN